MRERILTVPAGLAVERQTGCLPADDRAFDGLFTGGPARLVTLRTADRRIDAVFSCDAAEPVLAWLWVYPVAAPDLRYLVSYTEAGVSIDRRIAGAWQRTCDEGRCEAGLAPAEAAFWADQWHAIGGVEQVSDLAVALERAISALAPAR